MLNDRAQRFLVVDVGGTKTALAVAQIDQAQMALSQSATWPSAKYATCEDLLAAYLQTLDVRPERAILAIAGPVRQGVASLTNLPWTVSAEDTASALGLADIQLLNDLEAMAWSIPGTRDEDLIPLQTGTAQPDGLIALVAPGTGLGEAFLARTGETYTSFATEGGHADFAPTSPIQDRLLAWLREDLDHVSVERVCSGSGLPSIYRFLLQDRPDKARTRLRDTILSEDDPTPIILDTGLDRGCPICHESLQIFVDILAAEAGNLALKTLCTGGLYFGGGLPPRLLPLLRTHRFVNTFAAKGRFEGLLQQIPLNVLCDPQAVLKGAARFGQQLADRPMEWSSQ